MNDSAEQLNSITDPLYRIILFILLLIFSIFLGFFVATDQLATLASDSIHYLTLAAGFSPWESINENLQAHLANQDYPPLFPLLLGLSGANQTLAGAHLFSAAFLIPAFVCFFAFVARQNGQRLAALFLTVCLMLLPGTWENAMGILSENLYLFLTLWVLYLTIDNSPTTGRQVLLGMLLALVILTRSIGFTLLLAYLVKFCCCKDWQNHWKRQLLIPLACCVCLLLIVRLSMPATTPAQYLDNLRSFWNKDLAILAYLVNQCEAFFSAWQTALLRYWTDTQPLPFSIGALSFLLAAIGVLLELRKRAIHAWYTFFYCLIIVLWPYPGQMYRFLFPIVPLLLFHALIACQFLGHALRRQHRWFPKLSIAWTVLLVFTVFPSIFFTLGRYQQGLEEGLAGYFDYYHEANLKKARGKAAEQEKIFEDISALKNRNGDNTTIFYFLPEAISYFSHLPSMILADDLSTRQYKQLLQTYPASLVYLTRLHPRKASDRYSGLAVFSRLQSLTEVRSLSHNPRTGQAVSMLLRPNSVFTETD